MFDKHGFGSKRAPLKLHWQKATLGVYHILFDLSLWPNPPNAIPKHLPSELKDRDRPVEYIPRSDLTIPWIVKDLVNWVV